MNWGHRIYTKFGETRMAHPAHYKHARQTTGLAAVAIVALLAAALPVSAQYECDEDGLNMQCSEFGSISMVNQIDVRGEPVDVTVETVIDETYERSGARWIMFSVRHDAPSGGSPVSLSLQSFSSSHGDVYTTRIDHDIPNEINVWVHVVDIPQGVPIELTVRAEVADRGAFKIETLVMPFDRGYEPLRSPDGEDRTLYASTLLGVNQETGGGGGGKPLGDGLRTPGISAPGAAVAVLVLAGVAVAWRRGRQ